MPSPCARSPSARSRPGSSGSTAWRRSPCRAACVGRSAWIFSKEKITALGLPVDRIVSVLRTENQNIPVGEINEGTLTYLVRSPGQFNDLEEIRNLVVLTREGVPVYMRDIAEVRDGTEDFRSFTRVNGKPGVQMRVTKQSGENTVAISELSCTREVARINREVPGVQLIVTNDSAVFIESRSPACARRSCSGRSSSSW